jgi:hypothetical protein
LNIVYGVRRPTGAPDPICCTRPVRRGISQSSDGKGEVRESVGKAESYPRQKRGPVSYMLGGMLISQSAQVETFVT